LWAAVIGSKQAKLGRVHPVRKSYRLMQPAVYFRSPMQQHGRERQPAGGSFPHEHATPRPLDFEPGAPNVVAERQRWHEFFF